MYMHLMNEIIKHKFNSVFLLLQILGLAGIWLIYLVYLVLVYSSLQFTVRFRKIFY